MSSDKRLYLSKTNRKFLGVCSGLANYINLDPWAVRLAFVLGLVVGPWFVGPFSFMLWLLVPLYFVLWLCLESDPGEPRRGTRDRPQRPSRLALYRNKKRGKLLGVCAGLADYLNVGAFPLRVIMVVAFFMSGTLVGVAYLGAYFILDDAPNEYDTGWNDHSNQTEMPGGPQGAEAAKANAQECERKLKALNGRLAQMEAYTVSRHYKLHREFKDL